MKKREMSLILDKLEWHPLRFWRPFFAVSSNALESRDETSEEVMVDSIGEFSAQLISKQNKSKHGPYYAAIWHSSQKQYIIRLLTLKKIEH